MGDIRLGWSFQRRLQLSQGRMAVGQVQPGTWSNSGLGNIGLIYPRSMDTLLPNMISSFYWGTNISFLIANPLFSFILRGTKYWVK